MSQNDPILDNQLKQSSPAGANGSENSGTASFSAPPYSITSDEDSGGIEIFGKNSNANDEAGETAGGMIDDAGGIENLNTLFGANFGEDYQEFLTRIYTYESEFDTIIAIEGLPQDAIDELDMEYSHALDIEVEITDIVFDNSHKDSVDEETVDYINNLLDTGVLQMNLVEAIHEFYVTIEANKILELLRGIEGFLIKGIDKIKEEIEALENDLLSVKKELNGARADFAKAGLETFIDASLAVVGIGLVVCGSMTPGLNGVLFLGGIAAGALLARDGESTVPGLVSAGHAKGEIAAANILSKNIQQLHVVPSSIKDPKLLLQIAKEESKVASGYKVVPILNGVLSAWDLKNNVDDSREEYSRMVRIEGIIRSVVQKIDKKTKSILLVEEMLKKMSGFFTKLDKALETNATKLDKLLEEINMYRNQLGE